MCGLVGFFDTRESAESLEKKSRRMLEQILYRGPNENGFASGQGWSLGHARLSIMDPKGGSLPIWNAQKTAVIVGNNEIYNAPSLRSELEKKGYVFRSHSDTEVLLHAWSEWGTDCFGKLNGMFAVAIVDESKKQLVLARDALGIKPLHWTKTKDGIAFASEIKSLLAVRESRRQPDHDSLHVFMNLRFLPGNRTLFDGIERVPPGQWISLDLGSRKFSEGSFFEWKKSPSRISYPDAEEALATLLDRAVDRHLLSDVEVSTYLSGGIDSSIVTTLASRHSPGIRSFCMAFGEPTDENADARIVAKSAGTRHEDLNIAGRALQNYSRSIWHVEEPKINCIQGFVLAEAVSSKGLKVALSGLGGDELFAGYENNDILYPMVKAAKILGRSGTPHNLAGLQSFAGGGDFYFRAAELLENIRDPLQYYAILRNSFDHNPYLLNSIYSNPKKEWRNRTVATLTPYFDEEDPDLLNSLLSLEMRTKLVNDFLLTEDRVSMAHGLEVRVPFLDRELVEFALSLPSNYKYQFRHKKRILRDVGKRWLPGEILSKKKWGFSFNPYLLFQTELRPFAASVLTRERVEEMGLFSWKWIQRVMDAPPSPRLRWHYFNLWMMTGVVLWHDLFFSERGDKLASGS